ncbi:MAG: hypothetical protein QM762_12625 [Chryseolinea sp.]
MSIPQQERFSRLQFPVHKIAAKTALELFEALPGLRRYFQKFRDSVARVRVKDDDGTERVINVRYLGDSYRGVDQEDLVRTIKYIVFVYDADSDLITEYQGDHKLLKDAAAKEAGFKRKKDGEWPPHVQDILDFKETQVVDWILDYMKVKRNSIYKEIVFIEQELESLYRSRADNLISGRVDNSLMSNIKVRLEEKDKLYQRFYADHLELKKATQDDLYPVTPENVFKVLKISPEVWKVRQPKDVPKDTGVHQVSD